MLLQPEPLKIECSGKHRDNLNLQKKGKIRRNCRNLRNSFEIPILNKQTTRKTYIPYLHRVAYYFKVCKYNVSTYLQGCRKV